jgi:hypothetical protein
LSERPWSTLRSRRFPEPLPFFAFVSTIRNPQVSFDDTALEPAFSRVVEFQICEQAMDLTFAYRKPSAVTQSQAGLSIALSPNLRRERVAFTGSLVEPLRFREAISALHDVVISDLRYQPRDRTAYQAWREDLKKQEAAAYSAAARETKSALTAQLVEPMPDGLEADFRRSRNLYWTARQAYSNHLLKHDYELWRLMMPCDPVITVAEDSLFFECFSADESSYGCLSVARDAFRHTEAPTLGTTNVDYSWGLYEHFQRMRSYRETRFEIDPSGFDVQIAEQPEHREEKIDLPNSWLRGFMQMQAAMSLPMRRLEISREGMYNLLAFLRRRRAARSPRAVRFELEPGKPPELVLEPWEKRIQLHSRPYSGKRAETIRVWGRDRLRVLARQLPLMERVDVYLLGTGLPSFWVSQMGSMRMTLGLSGWTTNNWTGASALSQVMPPVLVDEFHLNAVGAAFRSSPAMSLDTVAEHTGFEKALVAASLNRLALLGQVIHDLPQQVYRWRQVMPVPLRIEQLGEEDEETLKGREIQKQKSVRVDKDEAPSSGLRLLSGKVGGQSIELLIDGDGRIVRGSCNCSHHFSNGLRKGPCRHLQALRNHVWTPPAATSLSQWFSNFLN